jgi:hypothetical protein
MNTTLTPLIVFGCLVGAVLIGRPLRGLLPESDLAAESRDGIKLALGLVSTMAALVLGLLVSSAKSSYDTERSEVIQMLQKSLSSIVCWPHSDQKPPMLAVAFMKA